MCIFFNLKNTYNKYAFLGVTAVDAGEVLDIMFTDFPAKYEEYRQYLRENRDNRASNKPPAHLATERSKQVCF